MKLFAKERFYRLHAAWISELSIVLSNLMVLTSLPKTESIPNKIKNVQGTGNSVSGFEDTFEPV